MSRENLRERLVAFYQQHNPEKVTKVDRIMELIRFQPLHTVHNLLLNKYKASIWKDEEIQEPKKRLFWWIYEFVTPNTTSSPPPAIPLDEWVVVENEDHL
jgi:hypothetical protein